MLEDAGFRSPFRDLDEDARLAAEHPDRVSGVILLDAGLPFPLPEDPSALLDSAVTNAIMRLAITFPSADDYVVIFTANATAALRLIGEAYPFASGSQFVLTADNHNSVNGIREFARRRGAEVSYAPITAPDLRILPRRLDELLDRPAIGPRLFAFPAQSNFTGVQHDLRWIEAAHQRGWDVLVDAAAARIFEGVLERARLTGRIR